LLPKPQQHWHHSGSLVPAAQMALHSLLQRARWPYDSTQVLGCQLGPAAAGSCSCLHLQGICLASAAPMHARKASAGKTATDAHAYDRAAAAAYAACIILSCCLGRVLKCLPALHHLRVGSQPTPSPPPSRLCPLQLRRRRSCWWAAVWPAELQCHLRLLKTLQQECIHCQPWKAIVFASAPCVPRPLAWVA
jgi:hypothetical protein